MRGLENPRKILPGTARILLALALLLPSSARADADGQLDLLLSTVPNGPQESPAERPAAAPRAPEEAREDGGGIATEEQIAAYKTIPPKPSDGPTRFSLEDRGKFRKWLLGLCRQDAVAQNETARVRFQGTRSALTRPKNKQGSLMLLLENYADDMALQEKCAASLKQGNKICVAGKPSSGDRSWMGLANWKSQTHAPAGASLSSLTGDTVKTRQKVFHSEFWELQETAALNGKPESRAQALRILAALKNDSTCGTRSIETVSWASRTAQK